MRDVTEVGVSLTASSWSSFTQSVAMMQATKVMLPTVAAKIMQMQNLAQKFLKLITLEATREA
jgi:hypothetical protein